MKALLRVWIDGQNYVWKDITYRNGKYYAVSDGERQKIDQNWILAIQDDNRFDKVECGYCHELIENNPEAIEAHFVHRESQINCAKCDRLQVNTRYETPEVQFTKVDGSKDGIFTVTQTYKNAVLTCDSVVGWHDPLIGTEDAEKTCRYRLCRKNGVKPINDVFMKYPGLFDTMITVDTLKAKGWNYISKTSGMGAYSGYDFFAFDGSARGCLYAITDQYGFVIYFEVKHERNTYQIYYSPKYDVFFYDYWDEYTEGRPAGISESKYETVTKKIRALYKGVSTNE